MASQRAILHVSSEKPVLSNKMQRKETAVSQEFNG